MKNKLLNFKLSIDILRRRGSNAQVKANISTAKSQNKATIQKSFTAYHFIRPAFFNVLTNDANGLITNGKYLMKHLNPIFFNKQLNLKLD